MITLSYFNSSLLFSHCCLLPSSLYHSTGQSRKAAAKVVSGGTNPYHSPQSGAPCYKTPSLEV